MPIAANFSNEPGLSSVVLRMYVETNCQDQRSDPKTQIISLLTLAVLVVVLLLYSLAFADTKSEITVSIPAKSITEIINKTLPIEITNKKDISGVIWIESIDKLKLGNNKISFFMKMRGEDIAYTAKIGKTPMSLNFGNINLAVNCNASLRYDRKKNILYVKPVMIQEKKGKEGLAVLVNALAGGAEFPLEIQKLKPIIAKFGNDILTVNLKISDIHTLSGVLFIKIMPKAKKSRLKRTHP